MKTDPRIDAYISKAAPFAQPVLVHLRKLVHEACPEVAETIKWNFPHFLYKNDIMCSMAAFRKHCAFSFWKAALMKDEQLLEMAKSEVAMGHLGRILSVKDLPTDKKMKAWIREAMQLNQTGMKVPRKAPTSTKPPEIPEYISIFLKNNKRV